MAKKYLLGLDLGTNSVGWCVTDENDQIVKKGGKSLWGARLFEEASPAQDRRMKRTNRRRLARRKQRIDLLQLLFKEEIDKIDPTFFLRLNQSAYHKEDKDSEISSFDQLLFVGKDYSDRDYHKEYPTIYHLRKALMERDEKADIRLIYLAMAHMIKYRGNFLNEGQEIHPFDPEEGETLFKELNAALSDLEDHQALSLPNNLIDSLKIKIATARGINAKKTALTDLFHSDDQYYKNVVFALIAGGNVATNKIFSNDSEEEIDPKSIQFSDIAFEENFGKLTEFFSDSPEIRMIVAAKKIYDFLLLGHLLGDSKTLSESMVKRYESHKRDLKALKTYIKEKEKCGELAKGTYNSMFSLYDKDTSNYAHYVGLTKTKGKEITEIKCGHCSRDDFYSYVKKTLKIDGKNVKVDELDPFLKDVYLKIEDKTYLERQNSSDNGVYPYQLNKQEMSIILEKQSKHYPFLNCADADGITTKDKIVKILEFKIPYYVGPLIGSSDTNPRGKFSWVVKNDDKAKIYPWNFDKLIDKDASAEEFIKRMLNKCTYLPDCYCLPKNSILFQEYEVLSLLNKTTINGEFMSPIMKKALIDEVFKKKTKVSKKTIENYFKAKTGEDAKVGTSGGKELTDINASLSSYCFFAKIFGEKYVDANLEKIENIIRDLTIFEDSSIVARRLEKTYGIRDKQLINAIKNKRMVGWGRLSRELLEMRTPYETSDGEIIDKSLISIMRDTNLNLMEIINDGRFAFGDQIKVANGYSENVFDSPAEKHQAVVDFVDDSYVSPAVKRPLIQAMSIIEDVEKILRAPIDEYYVEFTRTNQAKKEKTNSRREMLEGYYKEARRLAMSDIGIKKDDLERLCKELATADLGKFRSDKYYLYFLQMGRDMYSLEPINLGELDDYDIDHIVPQSLVKDDSISNRVLVHSSENRNKSAVYPLTDNMFKCGRKKAEEFYRHLKDAGMISEKKYTNLTRITPLTAEELTSFVNRQLTFTNQAVKTLVSLIGTFQKDRNGKSPAVVYSKAENVSAFRQKYDIVKSRDANDFHHAHDAYLNVCVGRAISTYYNRFVKYALYSKNGKDIDARRFLSDVNARKASLNLDNIFDGYFDEKGICNRKQLLDSDGGLVWDYSTFVPTIKKNIFKRFDVMTTTMQYVKGGQLLDATIYPKGAGLVPLKMNGPLSDTNKYGGKSGMKFHFFALVECVSGKKKTPFLASLPSMYCVPGDIDSIKSFLKNNGIECGRILIPCVKINAVLKRDSSKVIVSGVSGALKTYYVKNMSPNYYSESEIKTIKKIRKLLDFMSKQRTPIGSKMESWMKVEQTIKEYMVATDNCIVISPAKDEKTSEVKLNSGELCGLYQKLMNIDDKHLCLLTGMLTIVKTLKKPESIEKFNGLPIYAKAFQIMQLVQYFNSNTQRVDLTLLGGSGSAGGLSLSANLPPECSIVVESPTGFFTKTLWKGC